jgi:phage-related protein
LLDFLYEGSTPTPFGFQPRGAIANQKIRMLARLAEMAETGPPRNAKISHQIEPDLWQTELGRVRILWFYDEGRLVVLSHGFVKKSQRTPEAEKGIARDCLRRYREAKAQRGLRILED